MEVIINKRGFGIAYMGIPNILFERLLKKRWALIDTEEEWLKPGHGLAIVDMSEIEYDIDEKFKYCFYDDSIDLRINKELIEVIKELGENCHGKYFKPKIVNVPDNIEWEIREYQCRIGEYICEVGGVWE